MPSGRSTRSTSATNSRVVRCQGTERLPNASPTTRSAESSGRVADADARVADAHAQRVGRAQPESFAAELQHRGSISSTVLWRARVLGREVARHREATAADVQRVERLVRRGHATATASAERPHVVELEVRRVGEVDVAVPEVVEPEDAAAGAERGRARPGCSSTRSRPGTAARRRAPIVDRRAAQHHDQRRTRAVASRRARAVSTMPSTTRMPPMA